MKRLMLTVAGLMVAASLLHGHAVGTHMWLGSKTFQFWDHYDHNFYLGIPGT